LALVGRGHPLFIDDSIGQRHNVGLGLPVRSRKPPITAQIVAHQHWYALLKPFAKRDGLLVPQTSGETPASGW
jgi:hypothetical protein